MLCTFFCVDLQVDQINLLLAPMPGVVKAIDCSVDDTVEEGTPLITLEAMKMQNLLPAPKSGKVIFYHHVSSTSSSFCLLTHHHFYYVATTTNSTTIIIIVIGSIASIYSHCLVCSRHLYMVFSSNLILGWVHIVSAR